VHLPAARLLEDEDRKPVAEPHVVRQHPVAGEQERKGREVGEVDVTAANRGA
jgi:hypothetical protein